MSKTKPKPSILNPSAELEQRSIYSLKRHPKQEQHFPESGAASIDDLAADILANGLNEPLEITPDNRIISGHRRCSALKHLHYKGHQEFESVQVKVRYDLAALGEEAIERRLLQANLNRRHLTVMEFARVSFAEFQLRSPKKGHQLKLKQSIAEQFNVSVKKLERTWEMLKLPVELQRLVDIKKLPQGVALALLKFASPDEIEGLRQLAVMDGPVGRRARKLIARREPIQLRTITPRKILNTSGLTAADLHLHFSKLAQFLIELDDRRQLLKYRYAMRRLLASAEKLREVIDTLPQMKGVDDDPPITFEEYSWEDKIRKAKGRHSEGADDEDDEFSPSAQPAAKRTPPPLKLKKYPPQLNLRKQPPAA